MRRADGVAERYRAETGCAALADWRGDSLVATAPPAERWLLIESRNPWPRNALTALSHSAGEVARRCAELGYRPALIRRYGRIDRSAPRRWGLVDCRPGRESVRWGVLPSDEHLLEVLSGADPGEVSHEPVYLVCTHGRHDACCAVRGRPVAAALAAAYPERTWECSHVGGDRFAANVVVLPHGLFYGHVAAPRAVELAKHYDEGLVVPDLLRGSGAFVPPVQAAQHFARAAGHSLVVDDLGPRALRQLAGNHWQVDLALSGTGLITVEVSAHLDTVDAKLTCAGTAPATVRRFQFHGITSS
ncbi:sucrase ferredoxin [Kribbella sp. NPDC049174]|uniref:sucrase ferredoxin n=1 Tax=Kribbella sp. NPDC049174 TaxID=3364112 RepID=UPI00372299D6